MNDSRDHYSYTLYADPATARTFDEQRFGGPIGRWIADDQADVLARVPGSIAGRAVLDVGAGTGRASLLLAARGANVTGVDASSEMLTVARARAAAVKAPITFVVGDAHHLDFADRSFDVVISLRMLTHTPEWRVCLGELCRVARDAVVIDFPSARSLAAIEAVVRRVRYAAGSPVEPYRVFFDRQIDECFRQHGFRVRSIHRHFTIPIALHKTIGSPAFSKTAESLFRSVGLTKLLGSPITVVAERQ